MVGEDYTTKSFIICTLHQSYYEDPIKLVAKFRACITHMGAEREIYKIILGHPEAIDRFDDVAIVQYLKALGIRSERN